MAGETFPIGEGSSDEALFTRDELVNLLSRGEGIVDLKTARRVFKSIQALENETERRAALSSLQSIVLLRAAAWTTIERLIGNALHRPEAAPVGRVTGTNGTEYAGTWEDD